MHTQSLSIKVRAGYSRLVAGRGRSWHVQVTHTSRSTIIDSWQVQDEKAQLDSIAVSIESSHR
jgi:hypothetical protein